MTERVKLPLSKWIVVLAELLALGYLIRTEDLTPSGLLLLSLIGAVALSALASIEWPFGSLAVLIATSVMPRFKGMVFGLHLRPEHVGIGFVAGMLLLQVLRGRTRLTLRLQRFDYFLLAYIFLNFLTSAVTSPEPRLTLRWAMMNAIVIAPYFLIRLLIKSEGVFHKAFDIMLWIGIVESAYGIICFLSNRLFETQFGMEINHTAHSGTVWHPVRTQLVRKLLGLLRNHVPHAVSSWRKVSLARWRVLDYPARRGNQPVSCSHTGVPGGRRGGSLDRI